MQIDGQVGGCLLSNFGQRFGVLIAIDRDTNHIGTGPLQIIDQFNRRIDVRRVRGRHALNRNGMICSDGYGTDLDASSWVSLDFHGLLLNLGFENWESRLVFDLF